MADQRALLEPAGPGAPERIAQTVAVGQAVAEGAQTMVEAEAAELVAAATG